MTTNSTPISLSVINMKGGVGKTTIAALLSRYAAIHLRRRVLAIDLDPQANLSQALMGGARYRRFLDDKEPSIVEVFNGYQPPGPHASSAGALNISDIVKNIGPRDLQLIPSRFDFSDNLIEAIRPDSRCLARLIASDFQDRDLIIIDCTPTESIFTRVAYHASRYVLVPVRPEFFATIGFPLLHDSLESFRNDNRGHQIDIIGVVVNNSTYDGGNDGGPEKAKSMTDITQQARENGWHIFGNQLGFSRGFPKMMRGDYSYLGNAMGDYLSLAREFFQRPELASLQR